MQKVKFLTTQLLFFYPLEHWKIFEIINFCLTFIFTCGYFRVSLSYIGIVGWQKIRFGPIRPRNYMYNWLYDILWQLPKSKCIFTPKTTWLSTSVGFWLWCLHTIPLCHCPKNIFCFLWIWNRLFSIGIYRDFLAEVHDCLAFN